MKMEHIHLKKIFALFLIVSFIVVSLSMVQNVKAVSPQHFVMEVQDLSFGHPTNLTVVVNSQTENISGNCTFNTNDMDTNGRLWFITPDIGYYSFYVEYLGINYSTEWVNVFEGFNAVTVLTIPLNILPTPTPTATATPTPTANPNSDYYSYTMAYGYAQQGAWLSNSSDFINGTFKGSGDNYGTFDGLFNQSWNNITALDWHIHITNFGTDLRFPSWSDYKEVNFTLILHSWLLGDYETVTIPIRFESKDILMDANSPNNVAYWDDNNASLFAIANNIDIWVTLIRVSNTQLNITITEKMEGATTFQNGTTLNYMYLNRFGNFTVGQYFFDYPLLGELNVTHAGSGHFNFYTTLTGYNGTYPERAGLDAQAFVEWVTKPLTILQQIWNVVVAGWNIVVALFNLAVTAFLIIIPYLPWLLILWVIDAGVTSIKQGSFQPIGQLMATAWNFAYGIAMILIGIIQAIADALGKLFSFIPLPV